MTISLDILRAREPRPETPPTPEVEQITDVNDPRLTEFWAEAHRIAEARGYCGVYDEITNELGLVKGRRATREREVVTIRHSREYTHNGVTFEVASDVSFRADIPVNYTLEEANEAYAVSHQGYATLADMPLDYRIENQLELAVRDPYAVRQAYFIKMREIAQESLSDEEARALVSA